MMSWNRGPIFMMLAILLYAGCGDDDGPTGGTTDNPPSTVSDLAAIAVDDTTITLTWKAPDDPSKRSSVNEYDLRWSASALTEENWESAHPVTGEPVPGEPGETDTFTVGGLQLAGTYYLALRTSDDKDQWSDLSNVVMASTDTVDNRLLAYYPLVSDTIDVTGNQSGFQLTNVPFQDGGIYSNGVYIGSGSPDRSHATTPELDGFNLGNFTISAQFLVDDYYDNLFHPAFVGGNSWRWIGIRLQTDSTVALMYNNGGTVPTDTKYVPGTWHEGTVTYDGTTARLFLDGIEIASKEVVLQHGEDRNVSVANFGNGVSFLGTLRALKIYSKAITP